MEFTQNKLAKLCGVSATRIRQLTNEGVLQKNERDRYSIECVTKYIETIRKPEQTGENFSELLEQEKYREKKRQNDEAEKLLAPVELLELALEKTVSVMIPLLEMLPLNIKRRWPEVTADQMLVVKEVVAECRNALADAEIIIDD